LQAVSRAMAGAKILTPPAHRIWRELDGGEELRNMQNRDTAYGTANSAFLRRAIFVQCRADAGGGFIGWARKTPIGQNLESSAQML
jgi:hypothetical protein